MLPLTYFYVVDTATGRPLAIFPSEHCSHAELSAYEDRLRAENNVDGTRLVLRSSYTTPLPIETVRHVLSTLTAQQKGGSRSSNSSINLGST